MGSTYPERVDDLEDELNHEEQEHEEEELHGEEDDDDEQEPKLITKFLVSNLAAGSVIGKGGSNITEVQEQSKARVQLSRHNEFYPTTPQSSDRIMLLQGTVNQILTALHLVLTRISGDQAVLDTMVHKDGRLQLRLLCPSAAVGTIIGKAGATIKAFVEDSKAGITVSQQEHIPPGLTDRIVRITGDLEQLMRAVALIITKLSENASYARLADTSMNYSASLGPYHRGYSSYAPPSPAGGGRGKSEGSPALGGGGSRLPQTRVEVTLPVNESRIGAIIGKGGENITQMKSVVGVRIRISDKDDFVPGTRDRKVIISGNPEAVNIAQALILQKIHGEQ